jgi:hypothetical protein
VTLTAFLHLTHHRSFVGIYFIWKYLIYNIWNNKMAYAFVYLWFHMFWWEREGIRNVFLFQDWYDILTCKKRWCRVNEANKDIFWTTVRWKWIPPFYYSYICIFLHDGRIAQKINCAICPSDGRIGPMVYFRPTDE